MQLPHSPLAFSSVLKGRNSCAAPQRETFRLRNNYDGGAMGGAHIRGNGATANSATNGTANCSAGANGTAAVGGADGVDDGADETPHQKRPLLTVHHVALLEK